MSDRSARALSCALAACALGAVSAAPALGYGPLKRPEPAPAAGAIVASRLACSSAMPTEAEVEATLAAS